MAEGEAGFHLEGHSVCLSKMKTLHQLTIGVTPEKAREEVMRHAAGLGGLTDATTEALRARFERAIAEANDLATSPVEPQREFYAGGERLLRDLWQEIEDLRTGAWKDWPEFSNQKQRRKEEETE